MLPFRVCEYHKLPTVCGSITMYYYSGGFCCVQLERNGGEHDHNTIANHFKNPMILFQHMLTLFTSLQNCFQNVGQLQRQFTHLENGISQRTVHPGQLAKVHAEMQHNTKELLDRMTVLEQVTKLEKKQNGGGTQAAIDKNWQSKIYNLEDRQKQMEQWIRTLQSQQTTFGGLNSGGWKAHQDVNGAGSTYGETRLMELEKRVEELFRQQTALKTHTAELEMQLQASLASTHNGSFLWRIPDVSRRKRDAIDERITSIYSPPFYTGHNGYKMCVRAYLNGDGSGHTTHLSLFFVLMKGEYDSLLKWPFDYKVSMILVDQNHRKHVVQTFKPTPESSSFQRPKTDMNVASGCPQFAKLSVLDNIDYVKDNVLYIKCIVDTARIFHP